MLKYGHMERQLGLPLEFCHASDFKVGDRVEVRHQYFEPANEVWRDLPGDELTFTGQVMPSPSLPRDTVPEPGINIMPDEPYPPGDQYATLHPLYTLTVTYMYGGFLLRNLITRLPDE